MRNESQFILQLLGQFAAENWEKFVSFANKLGYSEDKIESAKYLFFLNKEIKEKIKQKQIMSAFTDCSIMPFGKHKGKTMQQVPADYLIWFYDSVNANLGPNTPDAKKVFEYIESNYDVLEKQSGL